MKHLKYFVAIIILIVGYILAGFTAIGFIGMVTGYAVNTDIETIFGGLIFGSVAYGLIALGNYLKK